MKQILLFWWNYNILTCKRFPITPSEFIMSRYNDFDDAHYTAGVKLFPKLEKHYESISKIQMKKPIVEDPIDTLQ